MAKWWRTVQSKRGFKFTGNVVCSHDALRYYGSTPLRRPDDEICRVPAPHNSPVCLLPYSAIGMSAYPSFRRFYHPPAHLLSYPPTPLLPYPPTRLLSYPPTPLPAYSLTLLLPYSPIRTSVYTSPHSGTLDNTQLAARLSVSLVHLHSTPTISFGDGKQNSI